MEVEGSSHPVAVFVALVLAVGAGVVAIFSLWANDQLLDTGSWVKTSNNLLDSKDVRHRVAVFLGEELGDGTEKQLLAAGEEETAAEVMPKLRRNQTELAERVVRTPGFARIWEAANRQGHRVLLRVLNDEGTEGEVTIELTSALRRVAVELEESEIAQELGGSDFADRVEPGAARIEVLETDQLDGAQETVRVIRHLTLVAVLIALAFYAVAAFLGRRRLDRTTLAIGVALAVTGFASLLIRSLAGHAIVDALLASDSDRDAADAAWGIVTSDVHDLAIVSIAVGAGVFVASLAWSLWRRREAGAYG